MAKALKRVQPYVAPADLAAWRAMSPVDREVARLDDALRAVEALLAERGAEPAAGPGIPEEVVAQVARRAAVPQAQAARVLRALQAVMAERRKGPAAAD
jgi:hypothetical protein